MKPLLLMDFDGVFNALNTYWAWVGEGKPNELDYVYQQPPNWELKTDEVDGSLFFTPDREVVVPFDDFKVKVQWSTELVHNINRLIAYDLVDFVWLTTWKEQTDTVLTPLLGLDIDLGRWVPSTANSGRRFFMHNYDHNQEGKWVALQEYMDINYPDERPPIIWFEDVTTVNKDNHEYPENTLVSDTLRTPALVFATDPANGVSREQWSAVEKWVLQFKGDK